MFMEVSPWYHLLTALVHQHWHDDAGIIVDFTRHFESHDKAAAYQHVTYIVRLLPFMMVRLVAARGRQVAGHRERLQLVKPSTRM